MLTTDVAREHFAVKSQSINSKESKSKPLVPVNLKELSELYVSLKVIMAKVGIVLLDERLCGLSGCLLGSGYWSTTLANRKGQLSGRM